MRITLLATLLLTACAPVRQTPGDDDDATGSSDTLQDRLDALAPGECDARWDRDGDAETPPLPTSGDGTAYYGLYAGVDCRAPSPVGLISFFFDDYQPEVDTDATVRDASINDMDEDHDPRAPELVDPGLFEVTSGDYQQLTGWWTGEMVFEQDDGGTIALTSMVVNQAEMVGVAGR